MDEGTDGRLRGVVDRPVLLRLCDEGALFPLVFLYHLRAMAETLLISAKLKRMPGVLLVRS